MRLNKAVTAGLAVALAVALGVALAGCGSTTDAGGSGPDQANPATSDSPSAGPLVVVASTDIYGDIAARIGGDAVSVTSIIDDPAADPHSYEASPRNQLALSKADIVIENGGGYDDFVDTMLAAADNPAATVLNAVEISGVAAPDGGEVNEHVWYDFPAMSALADALAAAMGSHAPDHQSAFMARAAEFKGDLASLEETEATIAAEHAGAKVAVTEPVALYLLAACGADNVTPDDFSEAVEEGNDVPALVLKETLDLFDEHDVALLAYNDQTADATTERVRAEAESHGIPVVAVFETLPAGKDYVTAMKATLDEVGKALDGSADTPTEQ